MAAPRCEKRRACKIVRTTGGVPSDSELCLQPKYRSDPSGFDIIWFDKWLVRCLSYAMTNPRRLAAPD
eukprot:6213819-Pleurochrysis_carterae.AAC.1